MPVAAVPSLTRMTRSGPLAASSRRIAGSSTWTPSAIISAVTESSVSTAPSTPVSRCENGRIAVFDQAKRAGNLRCERENPHVAACGFEVTIEQWNGGFGDSARRVNATAVQTDERAFEVDTDDFGGGSCRLARVGGACDVTRDVFEAAARFVGRRGDRGR